ncbi:hypothetical protein EV586_102668 [Tumebacillus sp. BK434]|uniref:hypothetical protein n=1 Tax=Tumebacillus sp. BK434 TaxID=2512169 RepID=UPI0010DDAE34|nr:hypothetical protein [Tumebacillus sp. BK434]TCP58215.1 hypothetical protein EV586_102668 [Tumebacillus sp. BK434]
MKKDLFELDLTVTSIGGAIEPDTIGTIGATIKCSLAPAKDEGIAPEIQVC